jgi:hypothetical protein
VLLQSCVQKLSYGLRDWDGRKNGVINFSVKEQGNGIMMKNSSRYLRVGCIRRHSNQGGRCNHHLDPNLCKI